MGRLGSFKPARRPPDGLGDGYNGLVLPDHSLVERDFHRQQTLALLAGDAPHGNAGPHRHDFGDVFGRDHRLARCRIPRGAHLVELMAQLHLAIPQIDCVVKTLRGNGLVLFLLQRLEAHVCFPQARSLGRFVHAHPAGSFVDQVDGFVRQIAIRHVTSGEIGRSDQGFLGDLQLVMLLVDGTDTLQNGDSVLDRRLLHQDGLEAALQGSVTLDVLAVLVEGGGADTLHFAAG